MIRAFCLAGLLLAAGAAQARSTRPLFFISDLHFGPGRDAQGRWDNFEDFRWTDDFAAFLGEIDRRGQGKATLVLNGDTLELWQSHEVPCADATHLDSGCSEADALRRVRRVIDQHPADLKLIGEFSKKGDNRVVLVPGNHDVALLWPSVRAEVMTAIGAPTGRVSFLQDGAFRTEDGLVRAEHGHQIGEDVNRFDGWPEPFATRAGTRYVQKPWGEQFVQAFYNQYELLYPIIDNLSSEAAGVRYAMASAGVKGTSNAVGRFLKYLLLEESREQFGQLLGGNPGAPPEWDLAAVRQRGDRFLVDSLPTDDPLRRFADDARKAGQMDVSAAKKEQLSDDELAAICDYRSALAASGRSIVTCPQKNLGGGGDTLGAAATSIVFRRNKIFRDHFAKVTSGPVKLKAFVFSHTHKADQFDVPDPAVHVVNTGAWQRLVTPARIEAKAAERHLKAAEAFKQLTPDDLDACYNFVAIEPYDDAPRPQLLAWRKSGDHFSVEHSCP